MREPMLEHRLKGARLMQQHADLYSKGAEAEAFVDCQPGVISHQLAHFDAHAKQLLGWAVCSNCKLTASMAGLSKVHKERLYYPIFLTDWMESCDKYRSFQRLTSCLPVVMAFISSRSRRGTPKFRSTRRAASCSTLLVIPLSAKTLDILPDCSVIPQH